MKKALLVIDMQNVCVGENHATYFKYNNTELVEAVNKVIDSNKDNIVIYIKNVMKKIINSFMCLVLVLSLCACGGNMKNVETLEADSELYSQEEIASAIETISKEFSKEWKGCTLTEIYYAGDDTSKEYWDWADRHDADEVIVLLSSFDVDSSGGDGSLNPNSTYDGWMWILVRTDGGSWKHVDHGY